MSNKPSAVLLMERKDKALQKLTDLQDKVDGENEIYENNLGYELTRALSGLAANQAHLTTADRLLQQAEKEEEESIGTKESIQMAKEIEIKAAEGDFNTAKEKYQKALLLINLKYDTKGKKVTSKISEKLSLLRERVKRFEAAVKVSEENIERLKNNVPKPIIRAKFAKKKAERELATVEQIKEMSRKQREDMKREPVIPVLSGPRPMPEDDDFDAYMSKSTGVDMRQLAADRAAAIAADKKQMSYTVHKPEEIIPEPVHKPIQPPPVLTEPDLEESESEIDDYQLAKDIEEAKQRQRHILLQIPKKPMKMAKCLPLHLSL